MTLLLVTQLIDTQNKSEKSKRAREGSLDHSTSPSSSSGMDSCLMPSEGRLFSGSSVSEKERFLMEFRGKESEKSH